SLYAAADAESDAAAWCFRRQILDRLPRRVSEELVYSGEAVQRAARSAPELFWRERVAVARRLASQRLDSQTGSAWVVSVVLPLLHGPAKRRRCPSDSTLARDRATRGRHSEQLPTRRSRMPEKTTAGRAPLGVRRAKNIGRLQLSAVIARWS